MQNTFVTGVDAGSKVKMQISAADVVMVHRWKAHNDCINWVSFVQ